MNKGILSFSALVSAALLSPHFAEAGSSATNVPYMTLHRHVAPHHEVSTNVYGSVTSIVDRAYVEGLGIQTEVPVTNVCVDGKSVVDANKVAQINGFASTNDVNTVKETLSSLSFLVSTNETKIAEMSSLLSTNVADVASLGSRVGTNETDIATLKAQVSTNTTAVSALSSRVTTNESAIAKLDAQVTTNKNDITALSSRVGTNETAISSIKTSVSDMNTIVTNINANYVTKTQVVPSTGNTGYAKNADSAKNAESADNATTADKLSTSIGDFSVTVFPSIEASDDGERAVSLVVFSNRVDGISTSVTTLEIDGSKVITANQIAPSETVSKAAKLAETANSALKMDDSLAGMFAVSNSIVFTNKTDRLGSTLEPDGTQVLTEALGKRQFLPQYQDGRIYRVGKDEYLDFSQTTGMSGLGGTGGEVVFGDASELFQKEKFTFRALDSDGNIDSDGSRTSTLTPDGSSVVTETTGNDLFSPRYAFKDISGTNEFAAADGIVYMVTADTNGVSVVMPKAADASQDFIVRIAPADTNGTSIVEFKNAALDLTDWQYDYPAGELSVFALIYEPRYFTFTQVSTNRWVVMDFAALHSDL